MAAEQLYLMTPAEIARGYLVGHEGTLPPARPEAPRAPRAALEAAVRRSLERPPCGVAFSGGRDSSAVLAVSTYVARRDGLAEPLPITRVFPDAAATDETDWQEMVIRHLGLTEWQRVRIHDELDLVGPLARPLLVEHGVLWPPTIHGDVPLMEPVRGGSVMDGEGGDEVLGVEGHRVAPLTRLLHGRQRLRWPNVRSALGVVAPRSMRAERIRRRTDAMPLTWLRPATREALIEDHARTQASMPLAYRSSVRMVPQRRTQSLLARNRRVLALAYDVEFRSPLLDADFVHALARAGGFFGHVDRAAALTVLVADLLPRGLPERTSKATFGEAFMGRPTREFVASWSGEGLDPEIVDAEELRRLWSSGQRIALTSGLLQQAWLRSGDNG